MLIEHLNNPNFRVAVFGPFNHGKSTLLNALLGSYTVPMSLIPTTGAAISIKYGESLQSDITFLDGTTVSETGTDILQRFAILDGDRRMRNDVASVAVFCPHPLLKNGIELVDIPGTNDRDEQDNIVRNQLLTADLVIQVLDARKLFTLQEIENLREWLISREIKTVIFVINFLNLLEVEEQKEVIKRARSIAQVFRLDFPGSISNLYRVDALPALKSRLNRDQKAAYNSGLINFESELYNLLAILSEQISQIRLPRLLAIAQEVKQSLETQSKQLKNQLKIIDRERNTEIERGRREAAGRGCRASPLLLPANYNPNQQTAQPQPPRRRSRSRSKWENTPTTPSPTKTARHCQPSPTVPSKNNSKTSPAPVRSRTEKW